MSNTSDRPIRRPRQQYRVMSLLLILTLMLSGRAMTLAFVGHAGGGDAGDPPIGWLMPLIGDAVVGLGALVMIYLILRRPGLTSWTIVVVWNAIAIWDALSAWIISLTVPWPDFFMIQIFGSSMFFAASAMHATCIWLLTRADVMAHFQLTNSPTVEES